MPQSVILIADVPGLGQLGDVCKVKDGFARNYLIPRRKALVASADALKRFEKQKEKLMAEREKDLNKSRGLADKVSKVGLVFERPVGQNGRLFGSVTPLDVVQALAKQAATVEKKSILMNGPIKTTGDHTIRVRIHSQVVVDVPVKVVGMEAKKASEHEHPEQEQKEIETPLQRARDFPEDK
jgi:large subunit ribosomal protein L9